MDYAVVNTKRSSLKVYSTTNTSEKNLLGTIKDGEIVEFSDFRTVNNVEWVKISTKEIAGWVILKHPSVNYSYLEPMDAMLYANTDASFNAAIARQTDKSSVVNKVSAENMSGTKRETTGVWSNANDKIKKSTVELTPAEKSSIKNFSFGGQREYRDKPDSAMPPQKVQNAKGYPFLGVYNNQTKRYEYDYGTDYSNNEFITAVNDLRSIHNMQEESSIQLHDRYSRFYNRFKVATPDDVLSRTFAHVFFTRPDCNILNFNGSVSLSEQVSTNPDFVLESQNNMSTLMQLVKNVGLDHQFMMLPSNRVTSFECKDRTIKSDTYGRTKHGNSIAYGRHIDDSQAASEVSIAFTDDRNLRLFRMHQLWVQYISDVNKGFLKPFQNHLANRELDYACSAYYIVCAENGEDIIYWSKLYGVFPTNIPDSIMTWSKGQYVTNPEINITYQYSFKRDWNADIISEFNMMHNIANYGSTTYVKTYDKNILSTGNTWVGSPFIEMVKDPLGRTVYKLRFRRY